MVHSSRREAMSFRAYPEVMAWLRVEAKRRRVSKNEVLNIIVQEARKDIATTYEENKPPSRQKRWWE